MLHLLHKKIQAQVEMYLLLPILHNSAGIAITLYVSGLLTFHVYALFDNKSWRQFYYLWANTCEFLFILALYQLIPNHRKSILLILIYSVCRLIFRILDLFLGMGSTQPYKVNMLFVVLLSGVVTLTIRQIAREWK